MELSSARGSPIIRIPDRGVPCDDQGARVRARFTAAATLITLALAGCGGGGGGGADSVTTPSTSRSSLDGSWGFTASFSDGGRACSQKASLSLQEQGVQQDSLSRSARPLYLLEGSTSPSALAQTWPAWVGRQLLAAISAPPIRLSGRQAGSRPIWVGTVSSARTSSSTEHRQTAFRALWSAPSVLGGRGHLGKRARRTCPPGPRPARGGPYGSDDTGDQGLEVVGADRERTLDPGERLTRLMEDGRAGRG